MQSRLAAGWAIPQDRQRTRQKESGRQQCSSLFSLAGRLSYRPGGERNTSSYATQPASSGRSGEDTDSPMKQTERWAASRKRLLATRGTPSAASGLAGKGAVHCIPEEEKKDRGINNRMVMYSAATWW
ncbi:hypothetical protein TESG_07878 [Trichophyton tonsurans CBS 112818]|uniref:Uncharacterized protein n=1 Tax=Trichophyton tonsurans (strain CBS 112818) TaxID=647933 RepID=F2SAH5_TRIT1|nr:hypothetical protein TESG_07878 [Trichophyton tonsurans CBS 112818]